MRRKIVLPKEREVPHGHVVCDCRNEGRTSGPAPIVTDYDCRCAIQNELCRRNGGFSDDSAKSLFAEIVNVTLEDFAAPEPKLPPKKKRTRAAMKAYLTDAGTADDP